MSGERNPKPDWYQAYGYNGISVTWFAQTQGNRAYGWVGVMCKMYVILNYYA